MHGLTVRPTFVASRSCPSTATNRTLGPGELYLVDSGAQYQDVQVSVRFKAIGGGRKAGLVWKYQDPLNHYSAYLDLRKQELAMYRVVNGNRIRLGYTLGGREFHVEGALFGQHFDDVGFSDSVKGRASLSIAIPAMAFSPGASIPAEAWVAPEPGAGSHTVTVTNTLIENSGSDGIHAVLGYFTAQPVINLVH